MPGIRSTCRTVVVGLFGLALAASGTAADAKGDRGPTPPDATTSAGPPADLDAMFIGAHPDDEAGTLSTFGQWREDHDVQTGVITITRGEGGGNAVGPEEGPALGLLREDEERRAVGTAGITDVYNLDKVDFYYTVSEPLTATVWDREDTLERTVRILRQTRPEVLVTMDPAPTPGNHGNHQESARLAVEAYEAAGDPARFPDQITTEGLRAFSPDRIYLRSARGTSAIGPQCAAAFVPADPSSTVYGVWSGARGADGRTWAAVERDAQRTYASQGWAGFPDVPADPAKLGCDYLTLLDSRTPIQPWGSAAASTAHAPLDGSLLPVAGGLPLGTGLTVTTDRYRVRPGSPFEVTVSVRAPRSTSLGAATASLDLPSGWSAQGDRSLGVVRPGRTASTTLSVTPAAGATPGARERVRARVQTAQGSGYNDEPVLVSPAVTATQQLLPQVSQYQGWADTVGVDALRDVVPPVLTLPVGGTRQVDVVVTNHGSRTESGSVRPIPPTGFAMTPTSASYSGLAPGRSTTVRFTVASTDPSLATSMEGGDYRYQVVTSSSAGEGVTEQALELVPTTTIGEASSTPVVDGTVGAGEYPGDPVDVSRRWEGEACTSAADCSATARLAWHDDTLYVAVTVTDDIRGTALAASDCKRHWRTDAVEIAIDPRGRSENTSTTFKAAILPWTAQGGPCALRDADAHQGDAATTAPGMRVASTVTSPYTGYTVETAIPMALLPSAVDPSRMGLDILPYDSDTQDKTGQTRLGWSVWGGVQGDPYRWGVARLEGYTPPAGRSSTPADPVIPSVALSSLDSPQSIAQAVRTDVALAGGPSSTPSTAGWATDLHVRGRSATVSIRARQSGTAHITVRDADGILGRRTVTVQAKGAGLVRVTVPLDRSAGSATTALVGWADGRGGTFASSATR